MSPTPEKSASGIFTLINHDTQGNFHVSERVRPSIVFGSLGKRIRVKCHMPNDIPDQLAYLAPAFDELAKFDPEDLGDDNPDAMGIVEAAVRKHVKGMTASDALQAIQNDAELLQQWMTTADMPDTASYIYGALFGLTMFADFDDLTS